MIDSSFRRSRSRASCAFRRRSSSRASACTFRRTAGVLNIGIEGMMLAGALAGVVVSAADAECMARLLGAPFWRCLARRSAVGRHPSPARRSHPLRHCPEHGGRIAGTTLALFALTGDKGISGSLPSLVLPSLTIPVLARYPGPRADPFRPPHPDLSRPARGAAGWPLLVTRTPFGLAMQAVGENRGGGGGDGHPRAARAGLGAADFRPLRRRRRRLPVHGLCQLVLAEHDGRARLHRARGRRHGLRLRLGHDGCRRCCSAPPRPPRSRCRASACPANCCRRSPISSPCSPWSSRAPRRTRRLSFAQPGLHKDH